MGRAHPSAPWVSSRRQVAQVLCTGLAEAPTQPYLDGHAGLRPHSAQARARRPSWGLGPGACRSLWPFKGKPNSHGLESRRHTRLYISEPKRQQDNGGGGGFCAFLCEPHPWTGVGVLGITSPYKGSITGADSSGFRKAALGAALPPPGFHICFLCFGSKDLPTAMFRKMFLADGMKGGQQQTKTVFSFREQRPLSNIVNAFSLTPSPIRRYPRPQTGSHWLVGKRGSYVCPAGRCCPTSPLLDMHWYPHPQRTASLIPTSSWGSPPLVFPFLHHQLLEGVI